MVGRVAARPRVVREQCQTVMSSRFAHNSRTWPLAQRSITDVPPEAIGMLPALLTLRHQVTGLEADRADTILAGVLVLEESWSWKS
jgi:hypothetical protein